MVAPRLEITGVKSVRGYYYDIFGGKKKSRCFDRFEEGSRLVSKTVSSKDGAEGYAQSLRDRCGTRWGAHR